MNHQEAKDILLSLLPVDEVNLAKTEVFRLSWVGMGYNLVSEYTGYDHDYVRKSGSQLWKSLGDALGQQVTKRNFRQLLEQKLAEKSENQLAQLEPPGGALIFSSPLYIERSADEARAYNEICRPGSVLRIRGPRGLGKSSLMLRVLDHAESEGYQRVVIDFQQADSSILNDLEKLLKWICLQICHQLSLESDIEKHWNPLTGSKLSCSQFIQQEVLAKSDAPVVLVINELNQVFDYENISRDFLPLLRSWFEEAKHSEQMQKLRQILVYSTEVYVQLDLNLSPFNVGLAVDLTPFTQEQIAQLGRAYGFNWRADGMSGNPVSVLHSAFSGHPYLTQLTLYTLASDNQGFMDSPLEKLKTTLDTVDHPGSAYNDFLNQLLADLKTNVNAVAGFRKIHSKDKPALKPIESYQLEKLGLLRLNQGVAEPINPRVSKYLLDNL